MNRKHTITNSDLVAYLDGVCDPRMAHRIEAALLDDKDLAARLAALDVPLLDMKIEFDGMLRNTPHMPPLAMPPAESGPSRKLWALVAMICLVVGGVAGFSTREEKDEDWRDLVAAYQALYVPDTLKIEVFDKEAANAKLTNLGETIGLDLLPAQTIDTLMFRRGQMLGFEGHPIVQAAFLSPDGAPVALCVTRLDNEGSATIASRVMRGMAAASWSENGYGFLLIGGTDRALINHAAVRFQELL